MPKTLLLADDSVTIQKVVGISFANEDVRIVTVDNGDDAVVRAREIRPDIVLADVVMPGKSGYDVCAALKGDPALAHIPVLLLTGTFETFDEDRAARVGADGHITKPFEAQALVELVNARLASGPATRPAAPAAPPAAARSAAKPAAEPEPFDFLEPDAPTASPAQASTARPVSADSEDAFAFEAESRDAIDLSEDADEFDLGNEATAARTTLLLGDEDDAFAEAATTPPVGMPSAPPPPAARPATAPPVPAAAAKPGALPPLRGGTAPPVRGGTAQPVGGASGVRNAPAPSPAPAAREDPDELTRLVIHEEPGPAAAAEPAGGDPLDGIEELGDPFAPSGPSAEEWDVAANELDEDPFAAESAVPIEPIAADVHDDATPRTFTAPLFDDDGGDELELTDVDPAPPSTAAPAAAPLAASPEASEISGAMREQVHTTIEKIAWEALGDVSERIVREAVARIEQVAWDVIPRLAETLIREEIRRMKGED